MTEQPGTAESRQLAGVFNEVARSLEPEPDVERTVRNIVSAVYASVPGAEHVGVSLLEEGRIRSVGPSSELVAKLDEIQHELSDGPCVDATFSGQVYRTGDLSSDPRWPSFGRAASELGVNSMLALRLFTANTLLGALNLYSPRPEAFDSETEHLAELFAAHAAVALVGANRQAQLRAALNTRDAIGMAKGILMQRHGLDEGRAFGMLIQASQHANMKLREVAQWLVTECCEQHPGPRSLPGPAT